METSFQHLLQRCLPDYGCAPGPDVIARLAHYLEMIVAAQSRVRLVGSLDPELLVRRHVGESLALLQVRPLGHERLVDLGSGAGFPGLALAIATPELKTTLVESNHKKALFLRNTLSSLGLSDRANVVSAFLQRRPPASEHHPVAGAQLVTVRALERMEEVPGWLDRWMDAGADAAFWVSRDTAERWQVRFPRWHWGPFATLSGATHRGIVLARKVSRGTLTLPAH